VKLVPLLFCAGCGAPVEEQQAIIGGQSDSGDPQVVFVVAAGEQCSGEIIGERQVLTAAHCLDAASTAQLFLGANGTSGAVAVSEIHTHPSYNPSRIGDGSDLAVLTVEAPFGVSPMQLNRSALSSSLVGQPVRLIGYGVTSLGNNASAGVRRQVSAPLMSVTDKFLTLGTASMNTCDGDSGGAALMTLDGKDVLVGVTSFGDPACAAVGDYTRVDRYLDFIDPLIVAPDMATAPPSQSGCSFATR
jgi:secreted trypsin-like serine protease